VHHKIKGLRRFYDILKTIRTVIRTVMPWARSICANRCSEIVGCGYDPDVVLLESCLTIHTEANMSDLDGQIRNRVWRNTPGGPADYVSKLAGLNSGLGHMTWTRMGQVLLAAWPELRVGSADFSLFATRTGAILSWTGGQGDPTAWAEGGGVADPFRPPRGAAWRLGVMVIDARPSRYALLAVMSRIKSDFVFHHAVVSQITGFPFSLNRIDYFGAGPCPVAE
jgi:hypothetical protein